MENHDHVGAMVPVPIRIPSKRIALQIEKNIRDSLSSWQTEYGHAIDG